MVYKDRFYKHEQLVYLCVESLYTIIIELKCPVWSHDKDLKIQYFMLGTTPPDEIPWDDLFID